MSGSFYYGALIYVSGFTPVLKTSENVMSDLLNAANDRGISADSLDFDLLSHETYYKGTVDEEWQKLEGGDLLSKTTETELRSSIFLIRQEYQIRIRPIKPHPFLTLRATVATDKLRTKAVLVIDPTSTIPLKKGIQEWLKEEINRKLLRHGIILDLCSANLDQEINRLLVKIQKEGPLKLPYRLPIGDFFPPVLPTDDKILLHYKELNKNNSMIEGIHPDDLLLEYVFPKHGRDGRGCDGRFIEVNEPSIKYATYIQIDEETIRAEEDEGSIRFYSKVSGFLQRKRGVFTISQELRLDTASFKETGSIETGIDKQVSLKIQKNVSDEDAVGTGINIDVQKLDVSGTVGSNAKIQACEVTIGAQTHKKSEISVTEIANVHLHRGNLKAREANIDILETGRIEADVANIKQMVGGEVIARIVNIDVLYSNARITALEKIEIQKIDGDGNNLIIDPHSIEAYHQKIESLEAEVRGKTSRLQIDSKEYTTRQISFRDKNARIKQIQQRVLEAQKSGSAPMKADVVRLQQYKTDAATLKTTAEDLQTREEELHRIKAELEKLYDADLHAVVTHHGIHNSHNRVIFIDPKTHQEYAITPNGKVTHIRLRREGEDKRLVLEN